MAPGTPSPPFDGDPGTGTAGANQNGTTPAGNEISKGAHTPGEVLFVGQDEDHSAASGPNIDTSFVENFVLPAFDLAVKPPLRRKLIWDQFVSWRPSGRMGEGITTFLGDDIDPAGADVPLVENLDVDSVTFGAWAMKFDGDEYGRAVSRTRLAQALTSVNIDPIIVDRVAFDAARAVDMIAKKAIDKGLGTGVVYYRSRKSPTGVTAKPATIAITGFLNTSDLQMGVAVLEGRDVMPFRNGDYVLLCNPQGAQHLKNERDTGGFRYVTARNEGAQGNSIYNGTIGKTEGVEIVVSSAVPEGEAYLMGRDALAKTFLNSEGYGENPSMVVAPVIDKLRRFLSWGWLHYVGYSMYDVRAIIKYTYSKKGATGFRPAGATGLNAAMGVLTDATATGGGTGDAAALLKYLRVTP
jgi:N4-gp56 family major capsid protein